MTVLFGHPSGAPFAYHAALAHFEAGYLESFCVPWMPSPNTLRFLESIGPLRAKTARLGRRHFAPLARAPLTQGRLGEVRRLLIRSLRRGADEKLAVEANDWLMRTMTRELKRRRVTAVHAYEDCSLSQFREAKRLGKSCIYELTATYYPAWEHVHAALAKKFADWLPAGGVGITVHQRREQKIQEMDLADLVLVPGSFAENAIRAHRSDIRCIKVPYAADIEFWAPSSAPRVPGPLRFLYAGQMSLRKGIPQLISAWEKAALPDAELELVGMWGLADSRLKQLPANVTWRPPCSPERLREHYHAADAFVFPSFADPFGLVLVEAMACGLPAIASEATAGPDIMTEESGRIIPTGDFDTFVESLRWFAAHRDRLPVMGLAARRQAETFTWRNYRNAVTAAVRPYV